MYQPQGSIKSKAKKGIQYETHFPTRIRRLFYESLRVLISKFSLDVSTDYAHRPGACIDLQVVAHFLSQQAFFVEGRKYVISTNPTSSACERN